MARTNRFPLCLILCFCLCPFLIYALVPFTGHQQVPLAQANLPQRQHDQYDTLVEPCPSTRTMPPKPLTHVIIDFTDHDRAERTNIYLRYMESCRGQPAQEAVSKMTVQGYSSLTNWTLVESAMSKARQIDEIHWHHHSAIPKRLVTSLEGKHPRCKLYYEMFFSNWDPFDRDVPFAQPIGKEHEHDIRATERESLLNSTLLYSIKAHIEYGAYPNPDDLRLIHRILATCPNTRELDLSLSWGGCIPSDGQPYAFDFSSPPLSNARLPPLEILRLDGYRLTNKLDGGEWMEWESSKPQRNILLWPWYYLPDDVVDRIGYPTIHRLGGTMNGFVKRNSSPLPGDAKINVDGWLQQMDWSHIHTLDLNGAPVLIMQKLQPVLHDLTSLKLHYGSAAGSVDFLENAPKPLSHLVLSNVAFNNLDTVVDTITTRHGLSLQSLELHEREDLRQHYVWLDDGSRMVAVYDPHVYLNASQISRIAESCLSLESLDIDLNRTSNTAVDQDVLNAINSFSSLRDLVLRLESPDFVNVRTDPGLHRMETVGHDPIVNRTFVENLFERVRTQQASLKSLQVFVGAWQSRYADRGMMGPPRHLMGHWHCEVGDEGREKCEGQTGYGSYWSLFDEDM